MEVVLSLECSTPVCSVALLNRDKVYSLQEEHEQNRHSEILTILIQKCLQESRLSMNDITHVAVSDGPGSYTGLRIGASAAKAICYINKVPLIALSSLESMAGTSKSQLESVHHHLSIIDARRNDAYAHLISKDGQVILGTRFLTFDEEFEAFLGQLYGEMALSGNATRKFQEKFPQINAIDSHIRSSAVNVQGHIAYMVDSQSFTDHMTYQPNYINPPNITKSKKIRF